MSHSDALIHDVRSKSGWSISKIKDLVEQKFRMWPCWFQVKIAMALYKGKDVIGIAPTRAGKTLSFWIPLLMALEDGKKQMTLIVIPLNLLGKQNEQDLAKMGLSAIAISQENATEGTFKVHITS